MYLKSLTLRGFKSFASATTLQFEPGITAVVGPNGSGKSNVVDALAWVMGEQGAKSLRGAKMEDVIFAGTSERAPLGRAQVELTIDNSDGALPIEYAEVTLSRTMFRNGGSEYAINGETARLLDVQELLSDSGIGHEMHVVVGQGQLDAILTATPEVRRGFVEEAAGVLKHRKRKEKAVRKLEATQTNLDRLTDLVSEIRRQLKPLGRQAEVARKAGVIQAEAFDAKARLLADDLVQATASLAAELADEQEIRAERQRVEVSLANARTAEEQAEKTVADSQPRLAEAQEVWYALSGLRERVTSTMTIASERIRHAADVPTDGRPGRDPDELEAEAAEQSRAEQALTQEVARRQAELADAAVRRTEVDQQHTAAEQQFAALVRAAADRREGLARLTGQVNSLRSRADAAAEQLVRLEAGRDEARQRADEATVAFHALEATVAGLDEGELGLDEEYEAAEQAVAAATATQSEVAHAEREAAQERAALAARVDALRVGLERQDGSAQLLAAGDRLDGLLGSVATLISVQSGYEAAVSGALGSAADAVAVADVNAAVGAFGHLKAEDLGRAGLLLAGAEPADDPWPPLPKDARYAIEVVTAPATVTPALRRLLRKVAVVENLEEARSLVGTLADVTAVTRDGDVLSSWFASGGSDARPSLIQVQAAVDDAQTKLVAAQHEVERLRFAAAEAEEQLTESKARLEVALARLHESDAKQSAIAEQLGQFNQNARNARGEAERLEHQISELTAARERDLVALAEMQSRLELASAHELADEPDSTERDRLAEDARQAASVEMEARLALRTVEERVRGLAGRAESLRKAAEAERQARAQAEARRRQLRIEGETAQAVLSACEQLVGRIETTRTLAAAQREQAEQARTEAMQVLADNRTAVRDLAKRLEDLVDDAHRDELARQQQRMRIEALAERALAEVGIESDTLMAQFGPDTLVPVLAADDDSEASEDDIAPEPVPYVREEQQARLRSAERNLQLLGRVNPLALEEYEAMQERHTFLSTQLEDLRQTRSDLLSIIDEVDSRVQEVFAAAFTDVATEFEQVFSRLFPGGEGKLILTEPDSWLTTGVDVEARPAGKKVKRLSLLSGGERSLVAVAFLVSLFRARPSPFYILDEVEAALDDTNLGRLLRIYEELRETSQLLVITHQKRTMEVADALYGVTMRSDGVSTVISQRLREA